jgi:hypothetical protein
MEAKCRIEYWYFFRWDWRWRIWFFFRNLTNIYIYVLQFCDHSVIKIIKVPVKEKMQNINKYVNVIFYESNELFSKQLKY